MHFIKKLIPQKLKNIYHLGQAILANFWYGFPSKKIKVIGVTGTNGKTTTCQMVAKILEEAGKKVAMISTINFKLGEKEWVNDTKYTTLSSFKVQKFIKQAAQTGCEYLILEVSSHSLDQHRLWGINFDTAVITNVTREHLDYHKTMDKYRKVKLKLFEKARVAVVNLDMEKPENFMRAENEIIYGYSAQFPISNFQFPIKFQFSKSKFQKIVAENIELGANYTKYQIQNTKFQLNLPGLFNVENALAAACAGLAKGISLEKISQTLEKIKGVPGRLEYVANNKGINIIIDYAVTPDSLEKLYSLIEKINTSKGKVIAVFGSCGERDRGKRPIMGKIVSRYANYVIITNEDPYNEEPVNIINEVFSGVVGQKISNSQFLISNETPNSKSQIPNKSQIQNPNILNTSYIIHNTKIEGTNAFRILDRREAIKKALQLAKPGDFIIVTGKGAEETMAIGKERIPWNDKKVIQEVLRGLS